VALGALQVAGQHGNEYLRMGDRSVDGRAKPGQRRGGLREKLERPRELSAHRVQARQRLQRESLRPRVSLENHADLLATSDRSVHGCRADCHRGRLPANDIRLHAGIPCLPRLLSRPPPGPLGLTRLALDPPDQGPHVPELGQAAVVAGGLERASQAGSLTAHEPTDGVRVDLEPRPQPRNLGVRLERAVPRIDGESACFAQRRLGFTEPPLLTVDAAEVDEKRCPIRVGPRAQDDRALEQIGGSAAIARGERPPPGVAQVGRCARGQLAVAVVSGATELRAVFVGLLEVVADDLVGRAPAVGAPEEPVGVGHVQVRAAALGKEVVGRVAHQDVREPIADLAGML
jgi:hypothetical protein